MTIVEDERVDAACIFTEATFGFWGWFWWLCRKLFRWKVNHAGLVIDTVDAVWVYEATPRGICKHLLAEKKQEDAKFFWFLFKEPLNELELQTLYDLAELRVDTPYAFGTLLDALRYWWKQAWGRKQGISLREPFYHCSGFVADICKDIGRPLRDEATVYVSPQMIHTSPKLMLFAQTRYRKKPLKFNAYEAWLRENGVPPDTPGY